MIETRRTCVLSTGHLKLGTREYLDALDPTQWPILGGPLSDSGYCVWAGTEGGDSADSSLPADLQACRAYARRDDFDYILFDCDAERVSGLPYYGDANEEDVSAPPMPWRARPGEFWGMEYDRADIGGQRMRIVEDASGAPVAWVLADEDDAEAETALRLIAEAPEIAQRYAALVALVRGLITTAENYYADNITHEEGDDREDRAPDGDDFNELDSNVTRFGVAAERIIAGL